MSRAHQGRLRRGDVGRELVVEQIPFDDELVATSGHGIGDQGLADANRICIYGASYGGYSTMIGLAKDPDVYKCGINYVGVTDLDLFTSATWSDFAYSEWLQHEVKEMFGDMSTERERLMAVSPVEHAGKIKAAVLMAYGAADVRVVPEHGTRMRSAVRGKRPKAKNPLAGSMQE